MENNTTTIESINIGTILAVADTNIITHTSQKTSKQAEAKTKNTID